MGQKHSHRARNYLRNETLTQNPGAFPRGAQTGDMIDSDELPCVVDGMPCTWKSQEERDRQFWNSVMWDNPAADTNEYAKAFPWHPYLRTQCPEQKIAKTGEEKQTSAQCPDTGLSGEQAKEEDKATATDEKDSPKSEANDLAASAIAEFDFGFDSRRPGLQSTPSPPQTPREPPATSRSTLNSSAPPDPTTIGLALSPPHSVPVPILLVSDQNPETSTWTTTLQHILTSGHIPESTVFAIQGWICPDAPLSSESAGLVPNLSRPLVGAHFYDGQVRSVRNDESGPVLVNGVCSTHSSSSSSTLHGNNHNREEMPAATEEQGPRDEQYEREHEKPSGLAFEEEKCSSSQSLDTLVEGGGNVVERLRLCEGTIATQAKLIRTLHTTIDNLNQQVDLLQTRTRDEDREISDMEEEIQATRAEIIDLRALIDFSSSIVKTCFERENGTLEWVQGLQARNHHNRYQTPSSRKCKMRRGAGFFSRVCRRKPSKVEYEDFEMEILAAHVNNEADAAIEDVSSTHAFRSQVDAIAEAMEQNLGLLREDYEDLDVKIEAYMASVNQ